MSFASSKTINGIIYHVLFLLLTFFIQHVFESHLCCYMYQKFVTFIAELFHCVNIPEFIQSPIDAHWAVSSFGQLYIRLLCIFMSFFVAVSLSLG